MDPSSPEFKKELRQRLTPLQFSVTQEKGTERYVASYLLFYLPRFFSNSEFFLYRAFSNKYYKLKDAGMYQCIACGSDLFSSTAKYDSGSGYYFLVTIIFNFILILQLGGLQI